jgi:hypothetical protein
MLRRQLPPQQPRGQRLSQVCRLTPPPNIPSQAPRSPHACPQRYCADVSAPPSPDMPARSYVWNVTKKCVPNTVTPQVTKPKEYKLIYESKTPVSHRAPSVPRCCHLRWVPHNPSLRQKAAGSPCNPGPFTPSR